MTNKFLNSRNIVIGILVLVTIIAVGFLVVSDRDDGADSERDSRQMPVAGVTINDLTVAQPVDQKELGRSYETSTKKIVGEYLELVKVVPLTADLSAEQKGQWANLLSNIEKQLLSLRLPGEYREIHFSLVSSFTQMDEGLTGDFKQITSAQQRIDELIKTYAWLQ